MGVFVPTEVRLRDVLVNQQRIPFNETEEKETTPNQGGLSYNFGTTEHLIYILEVETGERLEVQFVPENVALSREANITEIMVVSRNNPLLHYVNGKNTLSTTLEFYSDEPSRQDVYRKIRWLESLAMNDGYQGKIRTIQFLFGKMFDRDYWNLQSVRPVLSHFDAENGFYPLRATVQINLILDTEKKNLLISDVRL
jgi:hypothetical protein